MTRNFILSAAAAIAFAACTETGQIALLPESAFSREIDGKENSIYTLAGKGGMTAQITNYGARAVALWVPAADGSYRDVIWGYDSIEDYLKASDKYSGPIVGRYGNRLANGKFSIDGKEYQLTVNENDNQLHGGKGGFSTKMWDARQTTDSLGNPSLEMTYFSPDGEEGYPGNLTVKVTYTVTEKNEFVIDYEAETDAPTILNPTSHIYFNLHGTSAKSTDTHLLTIYADSFTPTDAELIPTGEISPVEGTPMDFRKATPIGAGMDRKDFGPIKIGGGYDHNWCLDKGSDFGLAAELYEPETGIGMKIYTDQPGLQFYAGQGMDGKETGKRGEVHNLRSGIALETQNYPDAPNHPDFPSAVLRPGEKYRQHSVYHFVTGK